MKTKDVLEICAALCVLPVSKEIFFLPEADCKYEVESDDTVNMLTNCCNLVLDALYCDYVSPSVTASVSATDGFADTSKLSDAVLKVLSLKNGLGHEVSYRYSAYGLAPYENGTLVLTYTPRPNKCVFFGEINTGDSRITERIFAYGVLSQYFLITQDGEQASFWDRTYKEALSSALAKRSFLSMPPYKRWL